MSPNSYLARKNSKVGTMDMSNLPAGPSSSNPSHSIPTKRRNNDQIYVTGGNSAKAVEEIRKANKYRLDRLE